MKRFTWAYLAAAVAVASAVAVWDDAAFLLALVNLAAVVVMLVGIRINRLPVWPCWGPIAAALAAWSVATVWVSLLPSPGSPSDIPLGLNMLFLIPFAGLVVGSVALLRRQRSSVVAPLLDVAMLAIMAGLLTSEFGLGPQLIPDLIVVALAFRLLLGARQPPAGWLLLGGIAVGVAADIGFGARLAGAAEVPVAVPQAGWVLARAAIAAAALHPSSIELMRRRPDRRWKPFLAPALVLAPAVAVAGIVTFHPGHGPRMSTDEHLLLIAAGCVVLLVLAFLRVALMLRRYQNLKGERHEEEAKFRALVEQLPVATYIATLDHPSETLYLSEQIEGLTGFPPQVFTADPYAWSNRVPEAHREHAMDAAAHHKTSGEALSLEYPFVRRDGKTIWLGHRATVVRADDGRPLYAEGVLYDITDAKEREKPLLQRMKALDAVFESAPVGVVTILSGGEIASVNPAFESMLGYGAEDLASMSLKDLTSPEAASELQSCLYKTLRGELRPHQTEVELVTRNGETLCADVTMLTVAPEDDDTSRMLCVIVEDVTERRRSRAALKQTAEQLESVIWNLPVIVFSFDAELRFDMVSGRGVNEFGTDLTDLVGRRASEFLADVPQALVAVENAFAGQHEHIVAEFPNLGGWWEVWYSPLRDSGDDIVGVLGVAANVCDRVAHEQAVMRSLSLLNTTFDSIADAVVATDLEGRPVTYNRHFPAMWGVDPEVWEGWDSVQRRDHIFRQIKQPTDARVRVAALESDPHRSGSYELELHDGSTFETRVVPQRLGDEIVGRVVSFHDVTEQRRAKSLLEDQARILRDIARDAPLDEVLAELCHTVAHYNDEVRCSICLTDEQGEMLTVAAAPGLEPFYEDIGAVEVGPCNGSCGTAAYEGGRIVVEDVLSDPLSAAYAEHATRHDIRSCWSEPVRSSTGAVLGTFAIYHSQPRRPGADEVRIVELLCSLAAVAIEHELAARARRSLEDRVRQAEKMEAVGRLARGFAHDLGNVLTAIGLNSDLLRHDVSSAEGQEALNDLEKATMMAGHLVNDLLNLMRPPYPELVDISALVHDMASLLRTVVKERVALDIRTETPRAWAEIDVSQFQQVLLNLVMNANEAIPERGLISIRLSEDEDAGSLLLTVEDDGIGMDAETQEQAFEPFFTTKRGGGAKGVGLGLASASSAVAGVGGLITIDSEPGRGTKVQVHLPIAEEQIVQEDDLVTTAGSDQ